MKTIILTAFILLFLLAKPQAQILIGETETDTTTLVSGLDTPWEILWGPDDHIWITERYGRVSRLDPATGILIVLANLPDVHEQSEAGLLGMALHPDFSTDPWVYLVYNYLDNSQIKEKLVRYTYSGGQLTSPEILMNEIGGAGTHNGSRLVFGPDGKLYMTTGDAQVTSRSQDPASLNGKILRLNADGTIPSDNPNPESYIWTLGHRNPQGMVFSPSGILYSSEHGPSNDDELNIIEAGRNYGWPAVHGFCDGPTENSFCIENNVREPLIAWTPTLAVAGIGYYDNPAIPAWQHSILMTNLKASRLVAMKLSEDGSSVLNDEHYFINWWGRLRDVCVSPDGRVFLATSNRDGRGIVNAGDDRIVEIKAKSAETGIIENGTIAVKIYPNPARERLTIETAGHVITGIDIFNIAGKKLIQRELPGMHDSFTLDIQLDQGIYFIRIRTEHGTLTERLIIEQ